MGKAPEKSGAFVLELQCVGWVKRSATQRLLRGFALLYPTFHLYHSHGHLC